MLPVIVVAAVLAAGGSGSSPYPTIPVFFPADFAAGVTPGTHWSGFDAPANRSVTITSLLWNQRATSGAGTARFEVLDAGGSVQCYIDVDCAASPGVDTRATCATPYEVPPGSHINLQPNGGNTCTPAGVLQVVGHM